MSAVPSSLENIDVMIDFLEKHIEAGAATSTMLDALQKRLDITESTHRSHPNFSQYYSRMLELQALLYGQRNEDEKAIRFLKEAVKQAGGVRGLRSSLLREYILEQSRPAVIDSAFVQKIHAATSRFIAKVHARRGLRGVRVGFVVLFGLVTVSVATLHFVPHAAAVPLMLAKHSEIDSAKRNFDTLTAEYSSCSSDLARQRSSVDTYDTTAVNAYNKETTNCETILKQQNQAANRYNSLISVP